MRNWSFVAINTICSKIASVTPNLAYVSDAPLPGKTQKACRRELGRFGGETWISDGGHSWLTIGAYRSKALSVVKPHEELLPLENQHPLRQLLANPNPVDTSFDLQYEQQMFEELCGVSYLWAVPNKFGVPCELWVLPSHWVWPRTGGRLPAEMWGGGGHGVARLQEPMWDGGQEVGDGARWGARYVDPLDAHFDELIAYYEVRPWGGMGSAGTLRLPPNEVIMTRWKSPLNKIDGYSKLAAVAQWIDTEESISASRWAQFINQARPELWVELGQGYEDPDVNEIARIEAKFAAKLQGEYNYGKPLITPPGAKVTALSFTPTEMAYFQCLDTETECLTAEGWKRFDELSLETRVACYDAETKTIVYHQPSRVTVQDYSGTMHRWEGDRVDALMTPNHRVHVRRPTTKAAGGELVEKVTPYRGSQRVQLCRIGRKNLNEKVWCVKRVEELAAKTTYGILGGAKAACDAPTAVAIEHFEGWRQREQLEDYSIAAEVWLRFLGYYLSEGCIHKRSDPAYKDGREIDITQKKHVDSFRQGIESTPFRWKDHVSQNGCTHWRTADKGLVAHLTEHCGTNSFNKRVPNYVKAWPAEQLEVLLLALLEGDGSALRYSEHGRGKPANHETSWSSQYYTSSRQLADDVQELAVKCGCTASITEKMDQREEFLGRPRYTVNISSRAILDVTPDMRSEVQYSGKVWCVTVPTGLFVVRRNGKAHVTGNSEDQIRDMILAAFQVPKSAVGIGEGMTYGSILATLAQLCTTCLNPRLAMRGLTLTKHLASRWRDRRGESTVRIWWDDCVPADPTQVNSDISQDVQVYAITPNEVRAIRGRKPYAHGGDDPMGQGPGGIMPIPLNTGEGLEDLAELIAPMKEQPGEGEGGAGEGQPGMPGAEAGAGPGEAGGDPGAGEGEAGDPMVAGGGPTSNAQNERTQGMEPARVDNPNGAPEGLDDEAPKKSWEIRKSQPPYSWCSTQFDLTDETLVEALRSCPILEEDLAGDGREQQPHITVRYGLEQADVAAVQELLRGFGPVRVRLGKTNCFPADEGRPDSDVVYLEVEGEALYRLHQRLLQLPGKPDDRPYTPHITLAYVAPGKGEFYKGDDSLEDSLLVLDQLTVTDQQGAGHTVDLRRMVQPARKGLVWKAKGGPCEQGETAANTGCTPAEGGGGGGSNGSDAPDSGTSSIKVAGNVEGAEKLLGLNGEALSKLASAIPGSTAKIVDVHKSTWEDLSKVVVEVSGPGYKAKREIYGDHIYNDQIEVSDTGKGLGTSLFASQVAEAVKHPKLEYIEAQCSRGEGVNGYYTWARLGYDAKLKGNLSPEKVREALNQFQFADPVNPKISDLMKTSEGRAWWKEHGVSFGGTFSLKEGSLSRQVLDGYLKARAEQGKSMTRSSTSELLDQVWNSLGQPVTKTQEKAAAGPCKPGQTADRTGCIPASGGGGGAKPTGGKPSKPARPGSRLGVGSKPGKPQPGTYGVKPDPSGKPKPAAGKPRPLGPKKPGKPPTKPAGKKPRGPRLPTPKEKKAATKHVQALGKMDWKSLVKAGANALEVKHTAGEWVKDKIGKAVNKLPPDVADTVRGVWLGLRIAGKTAFATYTAGQALAERMAQAKGMSPEAARRFRAAMSVLDVTAAKPVALGLAGLGLGAAAIPASMVPIGSATYLAYSAATDPMAAYRVAKGLVADGLKAIGWKKGLGSRRKTMIEKLEGAEHEALYERLAEVLAAGDDRLALVLAALDETGDLAVALEVAENAAPAADGDGA